MLSLWVMIDSLFCKQEEVDPESAGIGFVLT